jgi:hypothetical protein
MWHLERPDSGRVWLLTAARLAAGGYGRYLYRPATWDDVRAALRDAHVTTRAACPCSRRHTIVRVTGRRPLGRIQAVTRRRVRGARGPVTLEPGDRALVIRRAKGRWVVDRVDCEWRL